MSIPGDRQDKATVQTRYDALAARYIQHYSKPRTLLGLEKQRRARIAEEYIGKLHPSSILDLGCGPGYVTYRSKQKLSQSNVVGIDFSDAMLKIAKENFGDEAHYLRGDIERLPFRSNSFQFVYALGVFDKFKSLEQVFSEACRMITIGGHLLFTYPNKYSLSMSSHKLGQFARNGKFPQDDENILSSFGLGLLLEQNKLTVVARHFITYGTGIVTLPWTKNVSILLEKAIGQISLGRLVSMTTVWIVRKNAAI